MIPFSWLCVLALAQTPDWQRAAPGYVWEFPRDHGPHPAYSIEWWYFTGHLFEEGAPEPSFGYQFTFFRVGLRSEKREVGSSFDASEAIMGHAAITDFRRSEHRFSEIFYRACPLLGQFGDASTGRIAWSRAPAGTDGTWELLWDGEGFRFSVRDDSRGMAFDLRTAPSKSLVLHGEEGFSRKSSDGSSASLYYSFTRLETEGELTLDGRTRAVSGTSWMDREFSSSQLSDAQVGWDWFSLQLDDGRDVMLYRLRRADGSVDFEQGTIIDADGEARVLSGSDYGLVTHDHWRSRSGASYPSRWTLEIPSEELSLEISTRIPDQENKSSLIENLHYYEGSVRILRDGEPFGQGYAELTGYGDKVRLPL